MSDDEYAIRRDRGIAAGLLGTSAGLSAAGWSKDIKANKVRRNASTARYSLDEYARAKKISRAGEKLNRKALITTGAAVGLLGASAAAHRGAEKHRAANVNKSVWGVDHGVSKAFSAARVGGKAVIKLKPLGDAAKKGGKAWTSKYTSPIQTAAGSNKKLSNLRNWR